MIQIRPVDAQDEEIWRSLLELRERYPEGWTLVGARMVTLYAFNTTERRRALALTQTR